MGKMSSSFVSDQTRNKLEMSPQRAAKLIKDTIGGSGSSGYSTMFAVPRKSKPKTSLIGNRPTSNPKNIKRQSTNF